MRRALLVLLIAAAPAFAGDDCDALFVRHGAANGVDWRLLKAIATVESHLNPRAENRLDPSIGLMQIHCVENAARACTNRFDVAGWPGMTRDRLFDTDTNVSIGAQILAWNMRTYGQRKGIAAYNQWSARLTPRGQPFPNQYYVDKVLRVYRQLQEVKPQ